MERQENRIEFVEETFEFVLTNQLSGMLEVFEFIGLNRIAYKEVK